ncbi:hypothetical protein B0A55_03288 [Friedmanniomyces simplex]|uniref:Uncharacterized protein n=1 Tax=Friedmanniomyces simplex TaxID=329884 RepID=A0A4U0XTI5_9PEZI|nr:hypothetical protein B0A55_03288 [Friedmanniomyces simplex]
MPSFTSLDIYSTGIRDSICNLSLRLKRTPAPTRIMVQYREDPPPGSKGAARDHWKLDSHADLTTKEVKATLSARHFDFRNWSRRKRLRNLLTRSDRGLPSYERQSLAELRHLCQSRVFEIPQRGRKVDLIAILERADDEKTFPRFVDLPPELRLEVYGHHFRGLDEGMLAVQPPVTIACRLLRQEALPLFYTIYRFGLHGLASYCPPYLYTLDATSLAMVHNIADVNRLRIQKLRLHITDPVDRFNSSRFDIDLGGRDAAARVLDWRLIE